MATKEYSSIAEVAKSLVQWEKVYEPDAGNYVKYQEVAERWKVAYAAQLQLVDKKITTSMWQAPGL